MSWSEGVVLVLAASVLWPNLWILWSTRRYVHRKLCDVPISDFVLVLGCAPKLTSGADNSYFLTRMCAAAQLVSAGKATRILASGGPLRKPISEGGRSLSSEVDSMQAALIERGVLPSAIVCDPKGTRTRRSVEHALTLVSTQHFTIVSQGFHTPRAVYLARRMGLSAHAFNAARPPFWSLRHLKIELREVLSRVRAFWEN